MSSVAVLPVFAYDSHRAKLLLVMMHTCLGVDVPVVSHCHSPGWLLLHTILSKKASKFMGEKRPSAQHERVRVYVC